MPRHSDSPSTASSALSSPPPSDTPSTRTFPDLEAIRDTDDLDAHSLFQSTLESHGRRYAQFGEQYLAFSRLDPSPHRLSPKDFIDWVTSDQRPRTANPCPNRYRPSPELMDDLRHLPSNSISYVHSPAYQEAIPVSTHPDMVRSCGVPYPSLRVILTQSHNRPGTSDISSTCFMWHVLPKKTHQTSSHQSATLLKSEKLNSWRGMRFLQGPTFSSNLSSERARSRRSSLPLEISRWKPCAICRPKSKPSV